MHHLEVATRRPGDPPFPPSPLHPGRDRRLTQFARTASQDFENKKVTRQTKSGTIMRRDKKKLRLTWKNEMQVQKG